jgi:hypothetical protein
VAVYQAKQPNNMSIGLDGSDLRGGACRLRRNEIRCIHSNKLGLRGFRYPIGRGGLDDRQSDQRDRDKRWQRTNNDIPVPIGMATMLRSIE